MKALFHGIRVLAGGVALMVLIVSPLKAQVVQGCIEGSPVKKAALGYYFGNKRLVADSVKLDAKGCFAYQGAKMRPGFYTFFLDTAHAFDFFYGGSPVSITGSYTALRVVDFKDEDNIRFQEFQNLGMAVQRDFEAGALTAEQAQAAYAEKTTAWEQQNGGSRFGKLILARNPMGTRTAVEPGGGRKVDLCFLARTAVDGPGLLPVPVFSIRN